MSILDDLCKEVAKVRVVAVVGAGISIATTQNQKVDDQPVAGWLGLVRHGLDRCRSLGGSLVNEGWCQAIENLIGLGEKGHLPSLLAAAELIQQQLQHGGLSEREESGEFRLWLRETVGQLRARDVSILEALQGMDLPIVTTNYDNLIEEVTGRAPLTWESNETAIKSWAIGEDNGVVHLHGHFDVPESVTLGIRDYQSILKNEFAQFIMRVLFSTRTLLFIGFGATWQDPNFSALLDWAKLYMQNATHRHYRLLTSKEADKENTLQYKTLLPTFLRTLIYGDDFTDHDTTGEYSTLAHFLTKVRLIAERRRSRQIVIDDKGRTYRPADAAFLADEHVIDRAERLVKDEETRVVVLLGAAGSARGLFARQIARGCELPRRDDSRRFDKVIWMAIPLAWWGNDTEVLGSFHSQTVLDLATRLLEAFELRDMANLPFDKQLRTLTRQMSDHRTLVVIEGLEQVLVLDGEKLRVIELLKEIPKMSCVLVTSAQPLVFLNDVSTVEVCWNDLTLAKYYVEGLCEEKDLHERRIAELLEKIYDSSPLLQRPAVWQWAVGSQRDPKDIEKGLEELSKQSDKLGTDGYDNAEIEMIYTRLFEVLVGPLDENDQRVLLALSLFADPPDMDRLQPTTGLTQHEVEESLRNLERTLIVWQMWPDSRRLYASTLTLACSVRLYANGEIFSDIRRRFVEWAVQLIRNHGDWEQNSILMRSLLVERDNLRMTFEVAAKLEREHLSDEDWYLLGRTVGQLHHLSGSWEIADRCYERVLERLDENGSKALRCRIELLQVRSLAHKGEREKALTQVESNLEIVEREMKAEGASEVGKQWQQIRAEALLRRGQALHRGSDAEDLGLAVASLREAIKDGDLFTRVSARGYLAEILLHQDHANSREELTVANQELRSTNWDRIKAHHERLLGEVYLASNDKSTAREAFRRAESYRIGAADARLRGWIYAGLAKTDENLDAEKRRTLARQAVEIFQILDLPEDRQHAQGVVEELGKNAA